MDVHTSGDHLIVGGYDRKLCWFDLDLSEKPYKILRYGTSFYFEWTLIRLSDITRVPFVLSTSTRHIHYLPPPRMMDQSKYFMQEFITIFSPILSLSH